MKDALTIIIKAVIDFVIYFFLLIFVALLLPQDDLALVSPTGIVLMLGIPIGLILVTVLTLIRIFKTPITNPSKKETTH